MIDYPGAADWFAAIRAAPDDDTLRLVFADWLQERRSDLPPWFGATEDFIRLTLTPGRNASAAEIGAFVRARWKELFPIPHGNTYLNKHLVNGDVIMSVAPPSRLGERRAFKDTCDVYLERGLISHVTTTNTERLDLLMPELVSFCPAASFLVSEVISPGEIEDYNTAVVRLYDFDPREIWLSIDGHDGIDTDMLSDYKQFGTAAQPADTREANLQRARAALSDALRAYGEAKRAERQVLKPLMRT